MSHAATNWAVTVRGIKPGAKVVLWHLADSHNPHNGCFPSLEYLAHHSECSLASVKNHLNEIEAAGHIKRVRMRDPVTRKQLSTRYFLAFEAGFESVESNEPPGPSRAVEKPEKEASRGQDLAPGTGAKNDEIPGPNSAKSRGQNLAPNLVKEPVKEPSAESDGGDPKGPPSPPGGRGAPTASAAPGGEGAGSGAADAGRRGAVPSALRHVARDEIIRWLLTGSVNRFKAYALRDGPPPKAGEARTPGVEALCGVRIPNFGDEFDGPEAAAFIAALPLTARREVDGQVAWVMRWIAGGDPKEPPAKMTELKALEASLRKCPYGDERAASRNVRIAALREAVAREMAALGIMADAAEGPETDSQDAEQPNGASGAVRQGQAPARSAPETQGEGSRVDLSQKAEDAA